MANWFTLNAKNRVTFALQHPSYAFKVLRQELFQTDERFLAAVTGQPIATIKHYFNEPFQDPKFLDYIQQCDATMRTMWSMGGDFFAKSALLQYVVTRSLQPEIVVETGVANGISSNYILLAMQKNQQGQLYSIDIGEQGDASFLPPGKTHGWVVPEHLRDRWTLQFGDSKDLLPKVLAEVGTIDLFIHDSLHTYEHMMFEFQTAYPYLRSGGILITDDVLWNESFKDFVAAVSAPAATIIRGRGILKKG